jgi:predicted lipoprotein with Yx(FWY)xxD motif
MLKRIVFVCGIAGLALFGSCSKKGGGTVTPTETFTIKNEVSAITQGNVLTDGQGKVLYMYANDIAGGTQCTTGCIENWPIFYTETIKVNTGLNKDDFSTFNRADGQKQTAYKGWPLYYSKADIAKGDENGDNVGKVWFRARANYSLFVGNSQLVGKDGKNYTSNYTEGTGKTRYLVDAQGRTLYTYSRDTKNTNTYGKDDNLWPVGQITDLTVLPTGFPDTDFKLIDIFNKKQLVYKGRPVYYYGGDNSQKASTKGVSDPAPGVWKVINAETTGL